MFHLRRESKELGSGYILDISSMGNNERATTHSECKSIGSFMNKITVVIPCYNQDQFLEDCLTSIVNQTYTNWEAIVVDDASTEGNPELVVSKFRDSRIRVIRHQKNLGLGASRNTGFRNAVNEYVVCVDFDDMLTPSFLKQVGMAISQRNVDCVFTDFQLFGSSTDVWDNSIYDEETMTRRQCIPGPGTLMKKSLWEEIGGFCEKRIMIYNDDWDFWLGAVEIGIKVFHIPEPLYLYRRRRDSLSVKGKSYDYLTREIMYRKHKALFDRYRTGKDFLSDGYQNSAIASWNKGDRLRTAYLAAKTWMLSLRRIHMLKLTVKALIPPFLLRITKKGLFPTAKTEK